MKKVFLNCMLLLCALIAGCGTMWGQTVAVNDVLWTEPFKGTNATTTFSATSPWGDYINPTTFVAADKSGLTYSSSNAMLNSATSANMNGAHVWLNKKTTGYIQVTGIPLYNATKVTVSWAQSANTTVKVGYAFDGGSTYTELSSNASASAEFTSDELNVSGHTTINLKFYRTSTNTNARIDDLTLKATAIAAAAGTTVAPSISGNTPFLSNTTVTITNAASADGAAIYYTLNGDDPTTTTSETCFAYSAPFTVEANTTVKAIAKHDDDDNASTVTSKTFTKVTPMTVTAALTAIAALPNNGTTADQCVSGIVCTAGSLSSGAITYYISADGTETNRLQVYKGKGLNNANFEAAGDIAVGDEVVVYGTLKNYNGTTPEFDQGSYLLSKVRKPTPSFSLDIHEATLEAYTHETADATLTTNTDGEITCESSNNDVATVALKSAGVYTITAQSEGSATITIKSAASTNYQAAEATVAVTVNDSRTDAGLSYAEDEEEITWGDSFTGQDLTNTNSLTVTYSSTDVTVATVNATSGVVSVLKAGSTTIKATFAGNATYKAAVASYTLTVNKAEAGISYSETSFDVELNDDSFVAPTLNNPNSLTVTYASNNEGIALVDENDGTLVLETSAEGTVKITATFEGNDWYEAGSANYTINIIDYNKKGSKYNPYTVAEIEGQATATTYGNNIYVTGYIVGCIKDNKCYKTTADKLVNTNLLLADVPTLTFTEGVTVASNVDGMIPVELPSSPASLRTNWGYLSNNVLGYKVIIKGNAQEYFSTKSIKGTSEIIAVEVPATITSAGWATFSSAYALDLTDANRPAGLTAYQVEESGVNSTAKTIAPSALNSTVAANTGLLLEGAEGTYSIPVVASGTDISSTNKMVAVTSNGTVINSADLYVLAYMNEEVVFAHTGTTAATLNKGQAYLNLNGVAHAPGMRIVLGENNATNIEAVEAAEEGVKFIQNGKLFIKKNGVVYDAMGRMIR